MIEAIVTAVLSGGLVGSLVQVANVRRESRRLRLDEEEAQNRRVLLSGQQSSLAVEAAERSVATLSVALARADCEIKDLEEELSKLRDITNQRGRAT